MFNEFEFCFDKPAAAALGFFDGVHIGHQALIKAACEKQDMLPIAITFINHPMSVFAKDKMPKYLTDANEKAELLKKYGAKHVIMPEFTQEIADMTPESFIQCIVNELNVKHICVGRDYKFGKNAEGNVQLLEKYADKLGYFVQVVPSVEYDNKIVSSSRIRNSLESGDIECVSKMLGRDYSIKGTVVEGKKLGRTIGLPTLNFDTFEQKQYPKDGVYAAFVNIDKERWDCVVNIGTNPTVNGKKRTVETHIIGFSGDLYGRDIEVTFTRFLRGEKRFSSLDELRTQISADILSACRKYQ
ncbi:MAG: bifunctional riboflavin kinase/FAD synthetase [Clostridiales bacterium]|nr:bifunctional riboflavin kinase/FAD synthetase [Clostridiales bacterium]